MKLSGGSTRASERRRIVERWEIAPCRLWIRQQQLQGKVALGISPQLAGIY